MVGATGGDADVADGLCGVPIVNESADSQGIGGFFQFEDGNYFIADEMIGRGLILPEALDFIAKNGIMPPCMADLPPVVPWAGHEIIVKVYAQCARLGHLSHRIKRTAKLRTVTLVSNSTFYNLINSVINMTERRMPEGNCAEKLWPNGRLNEEMKTGSHDRKLTSLESNKWHQPVNMSFRVGFRGLGIYCAAILCEANFSSLSFSLLSWCHWLLWFPALHPWLPLELYWIKELGPRTKPKFMLLFSSGCPKILHQCPLATKQHHGAGKGFKPIRKSLSIHHSAIRSWICNHTGDPQDYPDGEIWRDLIYLQMRLKTCWWIFWLLH